MADHCCTITILIAFFVLSLIFSITVSSWQLNNFEHKYWDKGLLGYESVSLAPLSILMRGWNTKPFIAVGVFEAN